jgi:hypothetical protein
MNETLKSGLGKTALVLAVAGGALLGVKKCANDMEVEQKIEEDKTALVEATRGAGAYARYNYVPYKGEVNGNPFNTEGVQCEATDKERVYQCEAISNQCKTEIECTLTKRINPDHEFFGAGEFDEKCTTTKIEGPTAACSVIPETKRQLRSGTIALGIKALNAIDGIGAPGNSSEKPVEASR